MAVLPNSITHDEVNVALDVEFLANFKHEYDRLADILGIVSPEVVAAGTAMYQYTVSGSLNDSARAAGTYFKTADTDIVPGKTYYTVSEGVYSAVETPTKANIASYYELDVLGSSSGTGYIEGDEVALSKYEVVKTPIGSIEAIPYRKLVTANAILRGGYEPAVLKTDKQMLADVRAAIISKFFTFLATGTGTATGTNLQAALAYADAELEDTMETNGDAAGDIVHFVNRQDIADYLAKADVTVQNVFGMNYLQNFLGVNHIFTTNKVTKGTVIATPASNIHMYGVDFGTLGQAGLAYTTQDGSLVGVHHEPGYDRVSCYTNVLTGATLIAEVTDYIVKSTIAPGA